MGWDLYENYKVPHISSYTLTSERDRDFMALMKCRETHPSVAGCHGEARHQKNSGGQSGATRDNKARHISTDAGRSELYIDAPRNLLG